MDTYKTILTKLDVRQFDAKKVPADVKLKILEAARASGTGINKQHWRFILVQDKVVIKKLAEDSTSGGWVAGADFAVIVLADPQLGFHLIDSGRAVQDMQLAAWDQGVISGLYTGFKEDRMRRDFAIPNELKPTVVVGFGYPTMKILGKKNRRPLSELAFVDKYGNKFEPKKLN
ncbi:nitroreductase [archaeon 13_1_40CM_4_53_4]|nr:MAG: nitroreductase [archaeon 13_1_40CM_4_53_4]OLE58370.1 MAG: nitroreductase [Crenarchaeota archaeon 13_1_20CM_2_53_14]